MIFYDSLPAPSPRRVRLFIAEKGVDIETRYIDITKNEQLTEEFKAKNPYCTVPVLEIDSGTCLTETLAICHYLESRHPQPNLMGADDEEKALVIMWYDFVWNNGFAAAAEALRNHVRLFENRSVTGPHSFPQIPELAARGRTRTALFMQELERRLGESGYIAGDRYTFADINAFVFVEFAGWVKVKIEDDQINLRRWFDRIAMRPAIQALS